MGNLRVDPSLFSHNGHNWEQDSEPNTLRSVQSKTCAVYTHTKNISHRDLSIMKLRAKYGEHLVPIISIIGGSELGMGDRSGYYILLEKIEYRLADLGMISLKDGIYILGQGIQAIKVLGEVYTNFVFENDMIGISSDGQCKYWINSNYFNNEVESVGVEREKERQMEESLIYGFGERENEWICREFGKEGRVEFRNFRHTVGELFEEIEGKMELSTNEFLTSPYIALKEKFNLHDDYTLQKASKFIEELWSKYKIDQTYRIKIPTLLDQSILPNPLFEQIQQKKKEFTEKRILKEEGNMLLRGINGIGKQRQKISEKGVSGVKVSTSPKLSLKKNRGVSNKNEEGKKCENRLENTKIRKFELSELRTQSSSMLTQKRVIRGGYPNNNIFHSKCQMFPQTAA